jgi:outer membrane lipoprotein SlyB
MRFAVRAFLPQPLNERREKEHPMKKLVIAGLFTIAATGAIAQHPHGLPPGIAKKMQGQHAAPACENCGTVQEVRHEKQKGEGGAVGIIAGAAAGGLLGNQIGGGSGKTLATVGGAVAGGFVGNEVQKRVTSKDVWVTQIRMRDGSVRNFEHAKQPAWKTGSLVRVNGNTVTLVSGT